MPQQLAVLLRFPKHATRAAYRLATGKEPPAHIPTQRTKLWEDKDQEGSTEDMVFYDRVIVSADKSGIVFKRKFMTPREAANVNIPPGLNANEVKTQEPEIGSPLRELAEDEVLKLAEGPTGYNWLVWKADEIPEPSTGGGLTKEEHGLLVENNAMLKQLVART